MIELQTKINWVISILILYSCIACYQPIEITEPILTEEKMIKVVGDIHLAEARITDYNNLPAHERDSLSAVHYYTIFKIHGVDPDDFQQSIEAYMNNPDQIQDLYEKVLTHLQQEETQYLRKKESVEK